MSRWSEHVERWKDCMACGLCRQRYRICLGRGTVPCDVLFIGEAPGAVENAQGLPFVGPAGQLLDHSARAAYRGGVRAD
jgi:DNA polymerase